MIQPSNDMPAGVPGQAKVAAVQMVSTPRVTDNLRAAGALIGQAVAQGATLVVLPEYFPLIGGSDEALDRLARAPATARFITRKIALFLVGDNPPPALLQTLARSFERTDGDIAAVLETLFHTPEFRASLGQRFRDPVHYALAGLRLAHGDPLGAAKIFREARGRFPQSRRLLHGELEALLDARQLDSLDGLEAVLGRPLSERWQAITTRVGLAFLLMLMLLALYNDLARVL